MAALGMIEVYGFATSIVVADAVAKAADVTVVAIGYHDALLPGEQFDAYNFLDYFAIFQPSFEAMNLYTMVRPTLYGTYYYVDMHGTETVLNSSDTWDPHPTDAGHKYMAQQILKVLPKA